MIVTQRVPYGDQIYVTDVNAVRVRVWGKADEYLCKCTSLSLIYGELRQNDPLKVYQNEPKLHLQRHVRNMDDVPICVWTGE